MALQTSGLVPNTALTGVTRVVLQNVLTAEQYGNPQLNNRREIQLQAKGSGRFKYRMFNGAITRFSVMIQETVPGCLSAPWHSKAENGGSDRRAMAARAAAPGGQEAGAAVEVVRAAADRRDPMADPRRYTRRAMCPKGTGDGGRHRPHAGQSRVGVRSRLRDDRGDAAAARAAGRGREGRAAEGRSVRRGAGHLDAAGRRRRAAAWADAGGRAAEEHRRIRSGVVAGRPRSGPPARPGRRA